MDLSAGTLIASLITGSVGFGIYLYGKKEARVPQLVVGIALMAYPYFVTGALATWGIGVALVAGLIVAVRAGL